MDFLDEMIEKRKLKGEVALRSYVKKHHPEHYGSVDFSFAPDTDAADFECRVCGWCARASGQLLASL